MTAAYTRTKRLGFRIALGIGQHTNDRELSYYAVTPSGFEWEIGWNPITASNEDTWAPTTCQGISLWGHRPHGQTVSRRLGQVCRGIASLMQNEETVPELTSTAPIG